MDAKPIGPNGDGRGRRGGRKPRGPRPGPAAGPGDEAAGPPGQADDAWHPGGVAGGWPLPLLDPAAGPRCPPDWRWRLGLRAATDPGVQATRPLDGWTAAAAALAADLVRTRDGRPCASAAPRDPAVDRAFALFRG